MMDLIQNLVTIGVAMGAILFTCMYLVLAERKVSLSLTETAKQHIVRTGYDPAYGARPLKRAIQKEIETPLARLLLKGEVPDGGSVTVDFDKAKDALSFVAKA